MSRIFCAVLLAVAFFSAASCSKKSEKDDLADAQACLDAVPPTEPGKADACLPLVKDYTSQQAMILKCSIVMTSGGLMEGKIVKAYNALKDDTQTNKTAAYMAALCLDYPDIDTGYTKALQADTYCQATGVSGLKYISGVIVAGTFMSKIAGAIDISTPTAAQTALNTLITNCVTTPTQSCTDNIPALGTTVINLAGSYCSGSNADQGVCTQVTSAVTSAGGDSTNVGKAMLCYLNNKTFNPADGLCH
ncbi:MAG: hypothetical protein ACXWQE_12960 [Bdellovibrionales bacterium]